MPPLLTGMKPLELFVFLPSPSSQLRNWILANAPRDRRPDKATVRRNAPSRTYRRIFLLEGATPNNCTSWQVSLRTVSWLKIRTAIGSITLRRGCFSIKCC